MKVGADRGQSVISLSFESSEERGAFLRDLASQGAFLLKLPWEPRVGSEWRVRLEAGPEVPARVVQLFDGAGLEVGVAFEALLVGDALAEALGLGGGGNDEDLADVVDDDSDASETLGASPIHRIRGLNVSQRSLLATKADRTERRILLRDGSPQVLQALLANPRLEAEEVLRLVRSTHATAALLQRVLGDTRWGKNLEVVTAIARHPQTPPPVASGLMERLRTPDLRVMAKMAGALRETVRKAALREYLKRTGGHG